MTRFVDHRRAREGDAEPYSPRLDRYGLQGAATVHELRKIQAAFDREFAGAFQQESGGAAVNERHGGAAWPSVSVPKRRRRHGGREQRGVLKAVIDSCVGALGFGRDSDTATVSGGSPAEGEKASLAGARPGERISRASDKGHMLAPDILPANDVQHWNAELASKAARGGALAVRAIGKGLVQTRQAASLLFGPPSGSGAEGGLSCDVARSLERQRRGGLAILVAMVVFGGGWASFVPLSGAVIAQGALIAETYVKKIQHPTGGFVAQIHARDGMHVREGDLLVRLDPTQIHSNLQVVLKQLDQAHSRITRLSAERDEAREIVFPPDLVNASGDREREQVVRSERALFSARAKTRQSQKEAIRKRILQLHGEISGFNAQIRSKEAQIRLIGSELEGLQVLYAKQLVPLTRLTSLQREAARLDGEKGQMAFSIAEAEHKISEAELQVIQVDQTFHAEVLKDLRETQDKESELAEKAIALKDQLNHIDIRAPASGVVHQMAAHTIGGVVAPAEVIMEIVPDSDDLLIEARIQPNQIDHVHVAQKGLVRLSAFNQHTTPQLDGIVSYVAADASHDKQTNASFYTVRVTLPGDQRRRLGELQLVPGMPAEIFLQTGDRTMMSYLFKPLADQMKRSFSEP